VLIAAGVASLLLFTEFGWHDLVAVIESLNAPLLIALMCVLPLGGFSITVFYLVVGARFGPLLGGAIVAGTTAMHLIGSHLIARTFLRGPLQRMLQRHHRHVPSIPAGENAAIALMISLVPGPPYFARNYLLALSGVPFVVYFWICLVVYVARSYVTLFLGDLAGAPDRRTLVILVVVYVLKLSVCGYIIWRLRRRYQRSRRPPATATPLR
jgi:uncharacterized membrane protein YdjX (TVP38/TMEM64 family)